MIKFFLIFSFTISAALCVTYFMESLAAPIFQELLSAFVVIATITGTLSYALYSYVEGIAKDVASDNNSKKSNYNTAVTRLSELKKEILVNAFSVVGLLIMERIAHGFSLAFPLSNDEPFNWIWAGTISFRVACFVLSVFIAAVQFRGFIIANEYRSIISQKR